MAWSVCGSRQINPRSHITAFGSRIGLLEKEFLFLIYLRTVPDPIGLKTPVECLLSSQKFWKSGACSSFGDSLAAYPGMVLELAQATLKSSCLRLLTAVITSECLGLPHPLT